jgi:hypothetical protein
MKKEAHINPLHPMVEPCSEIENQTQNVADYGLHFWSIEDFQLITFYTAVLKYCSTTTHTLFICISHGNYNKK